MFLFTFYYKHFYEDFIELTSDTDKIIRASLLKLRRQNPANLIYLCRSVSSPALRDRDRSWGEAEPRPWRAVLTLPLVLVCHCLTHQLTAPSLYSVLIIITAFTLISRSLSLFSSAATCRNGESSSVRAQPVVKGSSRKGAHLELVPIDITMIRSRGDGAVCRMTTNSCLQWAGARLLAGRQTGLSPSPGSSAAWCCVGRCSILRRARCGVECRVDVTQCRGSRHVCVCVRRRGRALIWPVIGWSGVLASEILPPIGDLRIVTHILITWLHTGSKYYQNSTSQSCGLMEADVGVDTNHVEGQLTTMTIEEYGDMVANFTSSRV